MHQIDGQRAGERLEAWGRRRNHRLLKAGVRRDFGATRQAQAGLFFSGCLPISENFARASGAVVDPDLEQFAAYPWGQRDLVVGVDGAQFAQEPHPPELPPVAAVVELSVHHEADGLESAVHDDADVVPNSLLQGAGVAVPRNLASAEIADVGVITAGRQ